jgi:outer membrane protein assembly factor BamE (lipoprotein component of BamABCDE complex)
MKSIRNTIIVLSMISLYAGCAMFGKSKNYQPLDVSNLDELKAGETRASEVLEAYGSPSQVVKLSNGNAYVYERSVSKGTGIWLVILSLGNYETQYDRVVFFFDNGDILTHYGVSMNAEEASYGLPF